MCDLKVVYTRNGVLSVDHNENRSKQMCQLNSFTCIEISFSHSHKHENNLFTTNDGNQQLKKKKPES